MKKSIHVNPIAVIISNPICSTRGEVALRTAHHTRFAAKHAVKNDVIAAPATSNTAIAQALRVAEARAAAKASSAKVCKAKAHAEKIDVEAAVVKDIGKAIAVKYGKTTEQFRAAFLRIVEETVVKHGHKVVLHAYGADTRVGSTAARRAEKFSKAAKFAVDYSVTALIDKGWGAINAVSTVVNHDLTALRDALKERGKINCFAPINKEPIFEMKLQLFAEKKDGPDDPEPTEIEHIEYYLNVDRDRLAAAVLERYGWREKDIDFVDAMRYVKRNYEFTELKEREKQLAALKCKERKLVRDAAIAEIVDLLREYEVESDIRFVLCGYDAKTICNAASAIRNGEPTDNKAHRKLVDLLNYVEAPVEAKYVTAYDPWDDEVELTQIVLPNPKKDLFKMNIQLFGLPKQSNPANKAVENKAGNTGNKEVCSMKSTKENKDLIKREIAKYNAACVFSADVDLNNVTLNSGATVEQVLASVGFNSRQVYNAEAWIYMPDIADAIRAIGTDDENGINAFRELCLKVEGVGTKTVDNAVKKLRKYYVGAAGHKLANRPRRSTVAVATYDAYKELSVKDDNGNISTQIEIGYKSYGLSTRNQAIDHFGDELIEKMVKACTAIPQADIDIIRDVENAIKAFCAEADIAAHSGSQNRKCGYWAIRKEFFYDFFPKLVAFGFPGLRFGKMNAAVNKTLTRLGLLFSTAKPVFNVFGIEPNIRRMAVVKDEYFIYDNIRDIVETDGTVEIAKQHAEDRNKYDGAIWHRVKGLQGHPFIVRLLAIVKGLAVYAPDRFEELKQRDEKDVWGNSIDWDTVDWIVPESAFKVGLPPKKEKEYDGTWYRSFDEFIDAAEAVGARMYCASNFKLKRGKAPYQFTQCMSYSTLDEQTSYIKHCVDYMNEFMQIDSAWKLFGGLTGKVAKYYHPIMNHPFWRGIGAQAWDKKRTEILGMSCPNAGAWIPITYDWTGRLHGNEFAFICDGKSPVHFEQDKLYCGGKSPMPSPAAMMELRFNNDALAGLDVAHNVVIIAADSDYWAATNSDADGDTGFFCDLKWMNDAIHRTMKTIYGENDDHTIKFCPVLFPEGDAKKVKMTYSALKEYQRSHTKTAEIGPSVNSAAWHIANENFDRKTMAIELFLSNDGINAGKHGSQGTIKLQKRGPKDNPGFRMYTKNKLEKDKVTRTKGFCDGTCLKLYKAIPKTWEPDWLDGLVWNWEDLSPIAKEDQHTVPGLIHKNDHGIGDGVIDKLAFGDVEKHSVIESDDKETEIEWLADATASNRFTVAEYAHSVGFTFEEAYVYWLRKCTDFSKQKYDKRIETILRWGISECFGEEIVTFAMEYAKHSAEEEIESFEEEVEEEEFDF